MLGRTTQRFTALTLALLLSGSLFMRCSDHLSPSPVGSVALAGGLLAPLGVDVDGSGRVFVVEAGTGNNDGRLSIITNGKVQPAITNFDSRVFQGELAGPGHVLFADGILYITHDNGKLYKANLAAYKTGDPALLAKNVPSEDIAAFVVAQTNAGVVTDNPDKDSHPYHMVIGPGGDLFITDAAANCIVRRNKTTGALSILANIPGIKNPTPVGPPNIQSVPTGIVYDGTNFLVTGLIGFPFPAGASQIYRVTPAGVVTVSQAGFNALVGLDLNNGLVVLEYGTFGTMGWNAKTGRLLRTGTPTNTVLAATLNEPAAFKRITANSYFVVSLGDNALYKVTF